MKIAKRNKYIINTKLNFQEKLISTLKNKINALRMKASREKVPTIREQDNNIPEKQKTVGEMKTMRDKKVAVLFEIY